MATRLLQGTVKLTVWQVNCIYPFRDRLVIGELIIAQELTINGQKEQPDLGTIVDVAVVLSITVEVKVKLRSLACLDRKTVVNNRLLEVQSRVSLINAVNTISINIRKSVK